MSDKFYIVAYESHAKECDYTRQFNTLEGALEAVREEKNESLRILKDKIIQSVCRVTCDRPEKFEISAMGGKLFYRAKISVVTKTDL